MSIKFSCPHCSKALNVKDHLAGKKAQCPGCKKVLRIPSPDVDALAAAAFADGGKEEAAQPEAKMEFACPMCDEKISVNTALAGKQAPCPECRRIIKVPLLKKQEAKDWRKIDPRTGGARLDDVKAMEGAWSTESVGKVSRQALVEAKVIKLEEESIGWQGWVKRSLAVVAAVAFVAITAGIIWNITRVNQRDSAFNKAMAYVDETPSKLPPAHGALAHRLAGDYYLKLNQLEKAQKQYQASRAPLTQNAPGAANEKDLGLLALASDQVGLLGDKAQIDRKERLNLNDLIQNELRRTLGGLETSEGKRIAFEQLARQLAARGDVQRLAELAGLFPEDKSELTAIVGLELLRAKKTTEAETLAASAAQGNALPPPAPAPGAKQPAPTPSVAPSLVALWQGLGQAGKARALAPEGNVPVDVKARYQIGMIQGLGLEGKFPMALAAAKELPGPAYRVQALTTLAQVAFDGGQKDEAKGMVEEAAKVVEAEKGKEMSPWVLWRLVGLAHKVGIDETGQAVARNIADPALRLQAAIELLPSTTTPDKLDAALGAAVDKTSPLYAQALSDACRRQAEQGDASALQKAIPGWEPEKLRPFGYLGLALGLQDHKQ